MRTAAALALIAIVFAPIRSAHNHRPDGKGVALAVPPHSTPFRSNIRCSEVHPGHVNAYTLPPPPEEPAEMDIKVDPEKATVTGSLSLPPAAKIDACGHRQMSGCGRLKIVEGKTAG